MWSRRWIISVLTLLCAALLSAGVAAPEAAAQGRSYHAQRFDVDVVLQQDGSLLVTETVVFEFVGGTFSFVFRELETDWSDGIVDIEAFMDGRPLARGDGPGQVQISGNDPIRVEWRMEPFGDATRSFELRYRMLGVVRQTATADLLIYQPLPDEYEYTIDSSSVRLRYPATAAITGDVRVNGAGQWQQFDNELLVTSQNLGPDDTLVLEAPFARGSLISEPPAWQQRQIAQRQSGPLWIGAAVGIFVLGIAWLIFYARRHRPQPPQPPRLVFEPPTDLPPAMAGVINGSGAQPAWSNALATLFSLADKGILRIEETGDKSWFRRHDYVIRQQKEAAGLRPHEQGLLDMLFEGKEGRTDEVKLSKLGSQLSSQAWKEKFVEPLKDELKQAGFMSPARKKARSRLIGLGVLLIVASLGIFIVAAGLENLWIVAVAVSVFVLGLIVAITGGELSPLSDEGAAQAAVWQRFADHLKDVTKGKASVAGPDMFHSFLPYAASYGLLPAWAKWFEKEGWTELPPYFQALAGTGADHNVTAFVALIAATNSAGGSAAGASGAGAGAGAAGGGASGAG